MTEYTRVTMNLTERDVENTEALKKKMHARSNADVVSTALALAKVIADRMNNGEELCIVSKDKKHAERLIIPGLTA